MITDLEDRPVSYKLEHMRNWSYGINSRRYPSVWVSQLKKDPDIIRELSLFKKTFINTDDDVAIYHWWIGVMFDVLPNQLVKV